MGGQDMHFSSAAIALTAVMLASPAVASERDATPAERGIVVQHLKKEGYTRISDVDIVNGRFEADAVSRAGADVDVVMDMKTLTIIRENPS
jgi:hypothetical protein